MKLLYVLGQYLFSLVLFVIAPFHQKAHQMRKGRGAVWGQLKRVGPQDSPVWIHCASLGEFEQGRPVIEAIKKRYPNKKILLTFFSPSGYEVRKNYPLADWVVYLPGDSPSNARRFVEQVHPEVALFVKYEFWPCFFDVLRRREIPLYSVSTIFRENQLFFKWYGRWFRKTLSCVTKFYLQDSTSAALLERIGVDRFVVAGDTRFDRVAEIVRSAVEVPEAVSFVQRGEQVIVAGSTWPPDEEILASYINQAPAGVRLIIAPHEVHEGHIARLIPLFNVPVVRFSQCSDADWESARVLVVDVIGKLSALYRYGQVAYIGGGFGKGIHNTLEAATYAMPVIFGPRYLKFKEAVELIDQGGGFSVGNREAFMRLMQRFDRDPEQIKGAGKAAGAYTSRMCGATELIMTEIFDR